MVKICSVSTAPDNSVPSSSAPSVITGVRAYHAVAKRGGKPCAITGFEAVDILRGVLNLVLQIAHGKAEVSNEYERVVKPEGNPAARSLVGKCFTPVSSRWRGLGELPSSGLDLKPAYAHLDARALVREYVPPPPNPELAACRCGDVLTGRINPQECPCFGTSCTPADPLGACMVSQEGSCRAWYRYREVST